ncbi:MAG: hypothetical protein ACR2HH_16735 [Chthoniobacterales bacterium]
MKRLRDVFELTVPEQRAIVFLVGILVAVAAVKTYRVEKPVAPRAQTQPSPSPGIRP